MKDHRFFSKHGQHESGAGLVEYSPLILISSCLLFSLYQVLIQHEPAFLCFVGAIVIGIPAYIIAFIIYGNYRKKNNREF